MNVQEALSKLNNEETLKYIDGNETELQEWQLHAFRALLSTVDLEPTSIAEVTYRLLESPSEFGMTKFSVEFTEKHSIDKTMNDTANLLEDYGLRTGKEGHNFTVGGLSSDKCIHTATYKCIANLDNERLDI